MGTVPCTMCKLFVQSEKHLELHMKKIHLRTDWNCKFCSEKFSDRLDLRRHVMEMHQDAKTHACNICDKTFHDVRNMKAHLKAHEDQSCVCQDCGKVFKNKTYLKRHVVEHHQKVQRYACDQCDFKTHRSDTLKKHMVSHTGIFPHTCSTCGKGFKSKPEVDKHEDTHLPD